MEVSTDGSSNRLQRKHLVFIIRAPLNTGELYSGQDSEFLTLQYLVSRVSSANSQIILLFLFLVICTDMWTSRMSC